MGKSKKIWLGVLTFLPIIFVFVYIFFAVFIVVLAEQEGGGDVPPAFFVSFFLMFASIIIAVVLYLGIMIYYLMHASKDKSLDQNNRLVWILLLVLLNGLGNIVYWVVRIWNNPEA